MRSLFFYLCIGVVGVLLPVRSVGAFACSIVDGDLNPAVKRSVESAVAVKVVFVSTDGSEISNSGSGFVVSRDGYVVTAQHVIEQYQHTSSLGRARYRVIFHDCRVYEAKFVAGGWVGGFIPDAALLKIEHTRNDFVPLPIASARNVRTGDRVFAIGTPNGSLGIVMSGDVLEPRIYRKRIGVLPFIYASTPLQPGNSGGALVNESGSVIGLAIGCDGVDAGEAGFICVSGGYFTPIDLVMTWISSLRISSLKTVSSP